MDFQFNNYAVNESATDSILNSAPPQYKEPQNAIQHTSVGFPLPSKSSNDW